MDEKKYIQNLRKIEKSKIKIENLRHKIFELENTILEELDKIGELKTENREYFGGLED